jgi:hypothetical protein
MRSGRHLEHPGSGPSRPYSGSVGRTVLIMNSLNLSFSSVFGRCAECSNQTSCFRGAFNASKYLLKALKGLRSHDVPNRSTPVSSPREPGQRDLCGTAPGRAP